MVSLVSCSGTTTTTEVATDSTAIETPITTTETATNPAFETLLAEFETCNDVEKFLKNESCVTEKEYKEAEAKTKIESLSTQILAITGENAGVKNFGTEDFLKGILTYEDGGDMGTYTLSGLSKAYWEDLVFVSFMVETSASPMVNQSSTVLVFTKSGEFKEAFTNYYYSSGSQMNSSTSITSVEKTESLKLVLNSIEEAKDGTADETKGDFYVIAKDGTVTYDDSQKN